MNTKPSSVYTNNTDSDLPPYTPIGPMLSNIHTNNLPSTKDTSSSSSAATSAFPAAFTFNDHTNDTGSTGSFSTNNAMATTPLSIIDENRRRQGRLLLVSLLENFCQLYDQNPEQSRRLFFLICRALYHMGVINQEYIDEMAPARAAYKRAFSELVAQAITAIQVSALTALMYDDHWYCSSYLL
ncbi:hypothetical protein BDF19DRAFT_254801 [Syncephalis fuscata]|nr:hypothetical protein BDF19DRAFT_254801 [Syncephalis fuscata]